MGRAISDDGYFAREEFAGGGAGVGVYGGGLVGGGGGADKAGDGGNFAGGDFADHGDWSFSGAVECACADFGDVVDSGGCEADATPFDLGNFGGMHLGGGEYADDFCDSRCGVEHCVSIVEFEQLAGNLMGIYFFQ